MQNGKQTLSLPVSGKTGAGNDDPLLRINLDDPSKKADYKLGRDIAARIYKEQSNADVPYFYQGRQTRWLENRLWAKGSEDMDQFLDYMSIDGNKAWVNIDTTPTRIGAKFVRVLVNSMMNNDEYPCVKAVDDGSMSAKKEEKQNALFRMHDVETVTDMQQAAGMALEPPGAYVPDSEQAAEVHFAEEFKLPDEAEDEEYLAAVQGRSGEKELKKAHIRDGIVVNTMVEKVEKDANGDYLIRRCIPETVIYNYFYNESGKLQLSYIGEAYSLKVKDARVKYAHCFKDEKEFYAFVKAATRTNTAVKWTWGWQNEYLVSADRPYDDYSVDVFDFEIMFADADYYTSKKDNYGKEDIQLKRGVPQPTSDKVTVLKKAKNTVFRGVYAIKADKMLYWGLPDIGSIRPYQDIEQALFSYSIRIINNDGEYVPSLFEGAMEPLREYAVSKLKRKQLIANLRASGTAIDVARIRDVDLGSGVIDPMEVVKIYNQRGDVLWSSEGVNPNEQGGGPPITEMPNAGSIAQLNELCNIIDRCMGEIRGQLGTPLSRDGSDMPPRMGVGVVNNQLEASNNVTDDIYKAYLSLRQETLRKLCILKWDKDAIVDGDDSKLGKRYDVEVKMLPTMYEKQILEQNLQIALKEGFISSGVVARVRNIKNFKVASMYLSEEEEKGKKQAQDNSMQQQEQNGKIQQATQAQAAKDKEAAAKLQADIDAAKQNEIGKQAKETVLLTSVMQMFSTGIPIPPQLQSLVDAVLQNVAMPLVAENQQMSQPVQQPMPEEQMEEEPEMAM